MSLLRSLRLRLIVLLLACMLGAALLGGLAVWHSSSPDRSLAGSVAVWRHAPDYVLILLLISVGLAAVVMSRITRPLADLADAVARFASSLDPQPLAPFGPSEFQPVVEAFTLMQQRVSEGVHERLHMLSAVNHDLRTPLTRMALRLEQVGDPAIRERLRADVTLLETMVARGMELARGEDAEEPWARVDVAALLQTVVDEKEEAGGVVVLDAAGHGTVRSRPETLLRCLNNLVENGVRHGGGARVECLVGDRTIEIAVLDRGPGIPLEQLEIAFRPFTRLGHSARQVDGSGLGLTIARRQARSLGGDVVLENREGGGLRAVLTIPSIGCDQEDDQRS